MRNIIILGSGQNGKNTRLVAEYLSAKLDCPIVDLQSINFSDFDYLHKNKNDEFIPLMRNLSISYDTFIFCTPVYWYSMSAIMKKFFDRISDLLKIEKDLGRSLRGKSMHIVSCSGTYDQDSYFFEAFKLTANYLGISYLGDIHTVVENETIDINSKVGLDKVISQHLK